MGPHAEAPRTLPPVIGIVGPTASGKTRFSLRVARTFDGEIISCDSMQVYRGLDIGTDKIPPRRREGIPHHLIDVADPGEDFSAGAFRTMALEALEGVGGRGRIGVVAGGTGLYYRALTRGMIQAPPRDENLRRRLKERVRRSGVERCHRLLSRLDPDYAASIRNNDERRIVRALEVRIACGKPLGLLIQDDPFGSRPLEPHMGIGLTAPRELLYHRIESRVEAMLASGWIEEVQVLLEEDKLRGCVSKAIGYEEIAEHLAGRMPLEEAAEKIKQRSRNYAKRQLTWFRKEPGITWYTVTEGRWEENAIRSIEHWLEEIVRHT